MFQLGLVPDKRYLVTLDVNFLTNLDQLRSIGTCISSDAPSSAVQQ